MIVRFGDNLADTTETAKPSASGNYPTEFAGVEVYFETPPEPHEVESMYALLLEAMPSVTRGSNLGAGHFE